MRFPWQRAPSHLVGGPVDHSPPGAVLGFHGADLAALRPVLAVAEGDRVAAGQKLLWDRKRPWIAAMAPVAGVIARLEHGARRRVAGLEIRPEGEEAVAFDTSSAGTREGLTALMAEAGLWPALRARPFGRVPDPDTRPEALFVTAIETAPGAPDASAVIAALEGWFLRGLEALPLLSAGPCWLCHAPGLELPPVKGVTARASAGPHPAGLAGTHIRALHPVANGGVVWQIGWQEVIALGHLLETGRTWQRRIVALSGPAMARPGLVSVAPGARLHDIAAGRLARGDLRLLSGGGDDGLPVPFLRHGDRQVTALHPARIARPGRGPLGALLRLSRAARPALVPNAWDERLAPPGVLAVPLLRALAAGDAETARRLGALGLIEEDLAALNVRIGREGMDYAVLLRQTLTELEGQA